MDFSLYLEGQVCIVKFMCEKGGITRVINSSSTLKNLKRKHKSSHSILLFLFKKTNSLKNWELGFLAQRRSFPSLFSVHWLFLFVINTLPSSFIFHFRFSLGHPRRFHGKDLVFSFESDFGLILGMDNALIVWIVSGVEENFLLGSKVPSFLPLFHLKASSLGFIDTKNFILFNASVVVD